MRYTEFARRLDESISQPGEPSSANDKATVVSALEQAGYEVKISGNKLGILTDDQRETVLKDALAYLQKKFPNGGAAYSSVTSFGSTVVPASLANSTLDWGSRA